MTCTNCNTQLSCGCKKRVASDGKSVCTTCLNAYEQSLVLKRTSNLVAKAKEDALVQAQQIIYTND